MDNLRKRLEDDDMSSFDEQVIKKTQWVSISDILNLMAYMELEREVNKELRLEYNWTRSSRPRLNGKKLIPYEDAQKAIFHQRIHGLPIQDSLVNLGLAKEEDIAQELTLHHGFPYLPLGNYEINADALIYIPLDIAVRSCTVPVDIINRSLMVAMANPLNKGAIKEMEEVSRCSIMAFVSKASDIKDAIKKYYKIKNS